MNSSIIIITIIIYRTTLSVFINTLTSSPPSLVPYLASLIRWYSHRFPHIQTNLSPILSPLLQTLCSLLTPVTAAKRGRAKKITEVEKKRNEEVKQQQDNQQPVTVLVLLELVRELVREGRKNKIVEKLGMDEMMVKSLLACCWRNDNVFEWFPKMAMMAKILAVVGECD